MGFKSQILADISNTFFNQDEFADTCIYTPVATGVALPDVAVIIDIGISMSQTEYGAAELDKASFKASEIPDPKVYDTFVLDGNTYIVRERIKEVDGVYTVSIDTDQRQDPGS